MKKYIVVYELDVTTTHEAEVYANDPTEAAIKAEQLEVENENEVHCVGTEVRVLEVEEAEEVE